MQARTGGIGVCIALLLWVPHMLQVRDLHNQLVSRGVNKAPVPVRVVIK